MEQALGLFCQISSQGSHVAEFSVRNEQFAGPPKRLSAQPATPTQRQDRLEKVFQRAIPRRPGVCWCGFLKSKQQGKKRGFGEFRRQ